MKRRLRIWWLTLATWWQVLVKVLAFGWRGVVVIEVILAIAYYFTHIPGMPW